MGAKKHLFVLNPKSFWNRQKMMQVITRIEHYFRSVSGMIAAKEQHSLAGDSNDFAIHVSRFPRDAVGYVHTFAKNLPADTSLRVYAVGGDGILFDCLNGIMGRPNAELAAIPYGYTNNFVRGFGKKSKTLFKDISLQVVSPTIPIDVIHAGSNYGLSFCSIGVEAEAIRLGNKLHGWAEHSKRDLVMTRWLKQRTYIAEYLLGALISCWNRPLLHQRYEAEIDGEKTGGAFLNFSVFNGAFYCGGFSPLRAAMPNDGILDMVFSSGKIPLKAVTIIPPYLSGHYSRFSGAFTRKTLRKLVVKSDQSMIYCIDGIIFRDVELSIESLPGAIQFVDVTRKGYRGARTNE